MGVITAIRTAHPVLDARRLSTSDGYRFEDGDRQVRVWKGDTYVGRVPYEAIVLIEDEIAAPVDAYRSAPPQIQHGTQGKRKHRR
jgi:hypothetical protein